MGVGVGPGEWKGLLVVAKTPVNKTSGGTLKMHQIELGNVKDGRLHE